MTRRTTAALLASVLLLTAAKGCTGEGDSLRRQIECRDTERGRRCRFEDEWDIGNGDNPAPQPERNQERESFGDPNDGECSPGEDQIRCRFED